MSLFKLGDPLGMGLNDAFDILVDILVAYSGILQGLWKGQDFARTFLPINLFCFIFKELIN